MAFFTLLFGIFWSITITINSITVLMPNGNRINPGYVIVTII